MTKSHALHLLRRAAGAAAVFALALAPFVVYAAMRGASTSPPSWPAPVAVLSVTGGRLTGLGVLDPGSPPRLVEMPTSAGLSEPAGGEFRASTIFHTGGASLVASSLGVTLHQNVGYYATLDGDSISAAAGGDVRGALGGHASDVRRSLTAALASRTLAAGRYRDDGGFKTFELDVDQVRATLAGLAASPAVKASPIASLQPTIDPASVKVWVYARGASQSAALSEARTLRSKGFTDVTALTSTRPAVDGILVYFNGDHAADAAAVVAAAGLGASPAPAPAGYPAKPDVMVILGRNA